VLGPTFVEQYLPDGASQQHLLEPPHLLRREALKVTQQVRAALFRFLDARCVACVRTSARETIPPPA
jgi:hypothetical protein